MCFDLGEGPSGGLLSDCEFFVSKSSVITPGIVQLDRVVQELELLVHAAEGDEVLLAVQVHRVLDVLPVLGVLGVGVAVVAHLGRSLETHSPLHGDMMQHSTQKQQHQQHDVK